MILNGEKTMEVRSSRLFKHLNKRVGLCFSGTSKVYGFVNFISNVMLGSVNWDEERGRHKCSEVHVPYRGGAWGWVCTDPEWCVSPLPIVRNGAMIFQNVDMTQSDTASVPAMLAEPDELECLLLEAYRKKAALVEMKKRVGIEMNELMNVGVVPNMELARAYGIATPAISR